MLTSLALLVALSSNRSDPLAAGFVNPPASARPHTWWHWMNGNVTREGITADLEAMKEVGIGGAQMFTVDQGIPAGPAGYAGPKWRALTAHAVREAGRLGIELCLHNCAGWSSSGGPWIRPEDGMQVLAWSETNVDGPREFSGVLARPVAPQVVQKVDYFRDISVYAFRTPGGMPAQPADFLGRTGVVRQDMLSPVTSGGPVVAPADMVDITQHLDRDGRLTWSVPAGQWTILRMGHVPTGKDNHPAPPEGDGLEVDKLSRGALEKHWAGLMAKVIADAGPLAGKVLNNGLIDSYEVGSQNWTPKFREDFRRLRGYDPMPYLPVIAGYTVGDRMISDRFLWDFRRTIADLYASNYFGRFSELCHQAGLKFSTEPYGNGGFDNIQSGSKADIPMGEFWTGGAAMESTKLAASIGHVYGRPVIGAESFTADEQSGRWLEEPFNLKAIGDRAFCEGINRYIFHRYAMQPWTDVKPGMTMGPWGTHFDRTQTWWTEAKEWLRYVARCQFLLQRGKFVADLCYYYGEDAPLDLPARSNLRPALPRGYDFDGCDVSALLSMKVRNGRISLPSGMSYSVLVLPESKFMTRRVAQKIRDLVAAGATVVGPKPEHTPGLTDYKRTEADLHRIADQVWGIGENMRRFGRGRVFSGVPLDAVMKTIEIAPDFEATSNGMGAGVIDIHRKIDGSDVYFVSNQKYRPTVARLTFRVAGRVPELWHPDTGLTEKVVAYREDGGRTSIDLPMAPAESVFVVFRTPSPAGHLLGFAPKPGRPEPQAARIRVLRAFYGSEDGRGSDVTSSVQAMVLDGETEIPATNSLFGDPIVNVRKRLTIDYTEAGKRKQMVTDENGVANLARSTKMPSAGYETRSLLDGQLEIVAWRPTAFEVRGTNGKAKSINLTAKAKRLDLNRNWNVSFAKNLGAPDRAVFARLHSWPDDSAKGIRYFSGSAVYSKTIDVPADYLASDRAVRLDLGDVKNFATIQINGKTIATLWKPPFALDVTRFVHSGPNRLEVKVTNLWPNRIIGDEQLPAEIEWNGSQPKRWPAWLKPGKAKIAADRPRTGRITFATWHYFDKRSPLYPSGLIGPVRLESAELVRLSGSN